MQIPEKTITKWKTLKSKGDVDKLSAKLDCSGQAIRNVFNSGRASDEMFKGIAEFYNEKFELIKALA